MRCPQGKDSKEVKVSCRWNGLWLSTGTNALHRVCLQPAWIWKHVRTQQARAVCRALLEAFPGQCYLLRKLHACPHALHKADGFLCFLCGLKMKWTFNGMSWGIPHSIMSPVQGAEIWSSTAGRRICYSCFHLALGWEGERQEVSQ